MQHIQLGVLSSNSFSRGYF